MARKHWLTLAVLSLFSLGCDVRSIVETSPFTVTVRTSEGRPIEGAVIEGGIDWDAFRVKTNADGHATLPASAWSQDAWIHLDNYIPRRVVLNRPYRYELAPTPQRLRLLGSVEGLAVRFAPGRLSTLDYQGTYHLYSIDGTGLAEMATAEFPHGVKQARLIGDTLWLAAYDEGIFAYSLADPEHPLEVLHLAIPGVNRVFALRGNMIVVGNDKEVSSLGVYLFEADGTFVEAARFGDFYVASIDFLDGYLIATGYNKAHPRVYALDDPAYPLLVYENAEPEHWTGLLYGRQYIQIPNGDDISGNTVYRRLDLTAPALPVDAGTFRADSRLIAIIDDATAIGYYHVLGNALSVLKGGPATGYWTAAVISEDPHTGLNLFGGCAPPYFVISERLWVLEDRITP
jgi:hypothetical protein